MAGLINATYDQALKTAVRLLALRPHAEAELRRKLAQRAVEPAVIDQVLLTCRRSRYVDDPAYAAQYLAELAAKGFGRAMIRERLLKKGFSDELVLQLLAVQLSTEMEIAAAQQLVEKKRRQRIERTDPVKWRRKMYGYLRGRGFATAIIQAVLAVDSI